jgi:hypothetical protein
MCRHGGTAPTNIPNLQSDTNLGNCCKGFLEEFEETFLQIDYAVAQVQRSEWLLNRHSGLEFLAQSTHKRYPYPREIPHTYSLLLIQFWPARRHGHYRLMVGSGVSAGPLGFIRFIGEMVSSIAFSKRIAIAKARAELIDLKTRVIDFPFSSRSTFSLCAER